MTSKTLAWQVLAVCAHHSTAQQGSCAASSMGQGNEQQGWQKVVSRFGCLLALARILRTAPDRGGAQLEIGPCTGYCKPTADLELNSLADDMRFWQLPCRR